MDIGGNTRVGGQLATNIVHLVNKSMAQVIIITIEIVVSKHSQFFELLLTPLTVVLHGF